MIELREFRPSDLDFVMSSYCHSNLNSAQYIGMDRDDYFPWARKQIRGLLARPLSDVSIACVDGDEDTILGWALHEGPVLHYVYVKKDVRKSGIVHQLVDVSCIQCYTHRTRRIITDRLPSHWKYRPDLA